MIIPPILQKRKLSHADVEKSLLKVTQLDSDGAGIQTLVVSLQSPNSETHERACDYGYVTLSKGPDLSYDRLVKFTVQGAICCSIVRPSI